MSVASKKPLLIGVTGGIGSGKSLVCRVFETFGIPVYYADERAKWLVDHDTILKADVTRLLGPEAYDPIGRYNRSWVATQVFGQPELLLQLNALIHPRVYADTARWATQYTHKPYVVKEAALLRTAGEDGNNLDKLIVVQSPLELRIQRIKKRDPHRTEQEIQNIISRQMSDDERLQMADYVIYNNESQLLIPQVVRLHELFSGAEL
ncbi:dephospho-CoA kinase [Larkinella insperata]|uniref:Dephospho-CoA kinase n=1 Tax=Larkinella insperata TaxID=332158 RepID=A0ABW3QIR7_9BACT|nr:dephospho-CoA kinase [Larkinella insperata]